MARGPSAALCLLVLAVTAGCSGLVPGSDGTTARRPYEVPDTTVTPTPTATPTDATTATPTPTTGGRTPVASPAFRKRVVNHSEALRAAGQFVVREVIRQRMGERGDNRTPPVTQSFAADLDADRYWFGVPADPAGGVYDSGLAYQNGSTVYHRDELPNGTAVYRRVPRPREPTSRGWALGWLRGAPNETVYYHFERDGTATLDGESLARYTATDPGPVGCIASGVASPESLRNVTEFRATALVDDRGIVRRFECVLRGYLFTDTFYGERITWTVTRIGNATVRPPERLVNATESGGT